MGIAVRSPGGNYCSSATRIIPAVAPGLQLFSVYGGNVARSMRNLLGPGAVQLSNQGIDTAGPVKINTQYTGSKRAALPINEPVGGGTLIGVFAPGSLGAEVRHLSAWGQERLNAPGVTATVGASIGFGVVGGALAVRAWVGRTDTSGPN